MSFASFHSGFVSATSTLLSLAPFLALAAALFSLLALLSVILLERRLGRLMRGRGGSLEETITVLNREVKELQQFRSELEKYLKQVESRLRGSVQGVGVLRFNPFHGEGAGGNQSFAAAFLDESGSGVVFSTLYARDRVGVYAKPLEKGASTFELTEEEEGAVAKAQAALATHKRPLS